MTATASPSATRISAIVRKEWMELRRNTVVFATFIFLPVFMTTIASAFLFLSRLPQKQADPAKAMKELPPALAAKVATPQEGAALMLASLATMMFLIVPTVLPSITATHSIIGEKQARTLEPILATPVHAWELVVAKVVAAWIPAVIPTFAGYAIYVSIAQFALSPRIFGMIMAPEWVLSVLLLGPLAAILSVCVAVLISSRVTDLQAAQSLAGLVVLPVVGFGLGQVFTAALVSLPVVLSLAALVASLGAGALFLCIAMFERENILTRWK